MKYDQGLKNNVWHKYKHFSNTSAIFHLRILQIVHRPVHRQVSQSTIECDCNVVGAI